MPITFNEIALPDDLQWIDEFAWTPIQQKIDRALSGKQMIQEGVRIAGRTITLNSADDRAWMDRATVKALFATLNQAGNSTLTLNDGRSFSVRWDHSAGAIEAKNLFEISDPDDVDFYVATLKFITV